MTVPQIAPVRASTTLIEYATPPGRLARRPVILTSGRIQLRLTRVLGSK